MLFDPRPKERREDLYNFDEELNKLIKSFGEPLIVVSGLRRTGKTSLILTALNISEKPFIYIDLREGIQPLSALYKALSLGGCAEGRE